MKEDFIEEWARRHNVPSPEYSSLKEGIQMMLDIEYANRSEQRRLAGNKLVSGEPIIKRLELAQVQLSGSHARQDLFRRMFDPNKGPQTLNLDIPQGLVRPCPVGNGYKLIDGNHRYLKLEQLPMVKSSLYVVYGES